MEQKDIIERIRKVSVNDSITPSDNVWLNLEKRLDQAASDIPLPRKNRIFSFQVLSIAATFVILLAAFIFLILLPPQSEQLQSIHLEDLYSVERNSNFNTPQIGDASNIASGMLVQPIPTNYRTIDEGLAGKKLIERSEQPKRQVEYGLG